MSKEAHVNMRECGFCQNLVPAPARTCEECKAKTGTGTCRSCNSAIVRPPGKTGPLPKVCDECRATKTRWALMLPETKQKHAAGVTRRIKRAPEVHQEYGRRAYWHRKLKVIALLGGSCVRCGISNPLVLSVNHLDNSKGARADGTGTKLYLLVLRTLEPRKHFDLRCLNCQLLYEYETGRHSLPSTEANLNLSGYLTS